MKKIFYHDFLTYAPALMILALGGMTLLSSAAFIEVAGGKVDLNTLYAALHPYRMALYGAVLAVIFAGLALVFMNANKLRRFGTVNQQKEQALALLKDQLSTIQQAEEEKSALQEQLYQAQKLEAVGRLAGGIAHDFNNILAAMNGYAEFLTDDLEADTLQHGFANNILQAGLEAKELVDKMLAFSRHGSDEIFNMNLRTPIEETLSMLKASLPTMVSLNVDISDSDIGIQGSSTQITQALMNLCVNAKDAMETGHGELHLSLKIVKPEEYEDIQILDVLPSEKELPLVTIEDKGDNRTCLTLGALAQGHDYACLKVRDTGSGMSRPIMEQIFEPFFTTKPVDQGTGLGLAMVHGMMASHRGAVVINSVIGEGTSFELLFPTIYVEETKNAVENVKNTSDINGSVLLVEDQASVRDMMMTMLERLGFEAESCDDGQEALAVIRENPDYFDVVLTDQNMPNMTGLELIEAISPEFPDVQFVLLSGYSKEKMHEIMQGNTSIKEILKKPVSRPILLKTLEKAMKERSRLKPAA